jgi:hypothetical protein
MKREESEDVKKLRLEMEYRNYSVNSVQTYCDLMSILELSLSKNLKEMTLDEDEFIRRFLQHVLPSGFSKIRYTQPPLRWIYNPAEIKKHSSAGFNFVETLR